MLIAFDPGYTTGWCEVTEEGFPKNMGQIAYPDLTDFFRNRMGPQPYNRVVIEDYKVYRKKAMQHSGSDLKTSQVIGKIKFWAELNDLPVVMQPASILPIAQRWTQVKMPGNHAESHKISAFLHGAYYLMNAGIAKTALDRKYENG